MLVAVALAQERKAQGWPNQTIKDTREAEKTQAWPGLSHQVAWMDLKEERIAQDHKTLPWLVPTQESSMEVSVIATLSQSPHNGSHVDLTEIGGGSWGLKMGAAISHHAHGQRELTPGVDNPL
jgi:hypothetical protein